jgi:Ca2+-binding EF-hand superfamily protein
MSKKKKQQVIDAFKSADKNGDGKIDMEEYVQHFKVGKILIFHHFRERS